MSQTLQNIARSKTAIIAYKIYENWVTKRRFKEGQIYSSAGSTHRGRSLSESLEYIKTQFDDYQTYLELAGSSMEGKRVLEIGFGDNIGVALKLITQGAKHVSCLDKFYAKRNPEQEREIYVALRDTLEENSKARFDNAITLTDGIRINPDRIKCIYGVDVEMSEELAKGEPFDLVISRGAIQDIYNPDPAFAAMDKLLVPGGYMMHKIDLSDQGMFQFHGMNPLTFLTIPEPIYRLMAIDSGRPNRKLITYYREKVRALGYEGTGLITEVIGRSGKGDLKPHAERLDMNAEYVANAARLVKEIRPSLTSEFNTMSDEELMVSGVFLIVRKSSLGAQ